jgi:hypothetical protein
MESILGGERGVCIGDGITMQCSRNTTADSEAAEALRKGCAPETARAHLQAVIEALAPFTVGSREAGRWAHFVARELRDPGLNYGTVDSLHPG